ncbi:unnamed protein product [Vicia faba]|uniref:GRF-type domain-containing protein n=1 Tax=Vicia faba TaxID=3906 RepID=A0AAV0ZQP7_VICFA|nr:unnamed protein product [Vicia faba]CAI8598648.1 unnamed protein product [Vicia faba]CAI8599304.1 unnamed protein product [Vicia faba]CAI8599667.1 unnamed protein product [Vicia faba]CAI8602896.1 unnamed protein product [Vicia faba]
MSQKSVSNPSYRNRSVIHECHCGIDAPLMTAWTDSNPGRRFFGCGMYKVQGFKKCSNFVWLDEEMNPRAKEVIGNLLHNLNEEKQRVKESMVKEEETRMKIKFLKKQLKFNWFITIFVLVAFVATIIMK